VFVSTVISSTPFGRAVDVCKMYCVYHREYERNIDSKVPYKYVPIYCLNSALVSSHSLRNFVWLLFESGYYLRVVYIKLGTEDEEIHWLQMPAGNPKRHCYAHLPLQRIPNSRNQTPLQMSCRRMNSFWKTADPLYYAFYNP